MTNSFIYGLVDPETQELRYIGKTRVGLKRALAEHSAHCRNWIRRLKRRGLVQEVVILEETENLNEAECRLISWFRKLGHPLTNIAGGGGGTSGFKHSDKARKAISNALRERVVSSETRKKMSDAQRGEKNPWFGRRQPEEMVLRRTQNIRLNHPMKGKKHSEEMLLKLKAAHKKQLGKSLSTEHRSKISVSLTGVQKSDEHRRKLSESRKKYFERQTGHSNS